MKVGGGRRNRRRNPLDTRARCQRWNRVGGRLPLQQRRRLRQRPSGLSSYLADAGPADAGPAQGLIPRILGRTKCQVDTPPPIPSNGQLPVPYPETIQSGPLHPNPGAPAFFTGHWLTFDGRGTQSQRGQDLCSKLHSKSEQKLCTRSETCPPPTISGFVVLLAVGTTSSPPTLVPELPEARPTPCPFGGVVRVARQEGDESHLSRPL